MVPEIRLHLAEDAVVWWARMQAGAGPELPTPYWASAWIGGQALARYILDHPDQVSGRRVLDVAAGSGLVAIAAGLAGAARVTANDIDPNAIRAVAINALANGVEIDVIGHDLLDGDGGDAELVLAGDVFYDQAMTARVVPFLRRVVARGGRVLLGDPGRADLPLDLLRVVATYSAAAAATFSDAEVSQVHVLELAGL